MGLIDRQENISMVKNLNPMEHSENQVGLQPHSPTLSATYGIIYQVYFKEDFVKSDALLSIDVLKFSLRALIIF